MKKKNNNGYTDLKNHLVALSVDCVVFGYDNADKNLKVLLIKSETKEFQGSWSLLGDLVSPKEELNDAAIRILKKRTGMQDVYLEQVSVFGAPTRHPAGRVVTIAYYSLIKIEDYHLNIKKPDLEARWHSIGEIGQLAFDHNEILELCYDRLKKGLQERPVGFSMLPKKFSLKQLQNLYEVVLNVEVDRRNFRRKLRNHNILVELPEIQEGVTHLPAKLYTFDRSKYHELLAKGKTFNIP